MGDFLCVTACRAGDTDMLYSAWVPRDWLQRHPYPWGIVQCYEELAHLKYAHACAAKIQCIYRGKKDRCTTDEMRVEKTKAHEKILEQKARAEAEWNARSEERAASQGPLIIARLYDYIQEKKIKVVDVFHQIDSDGSGYLDKEEFRRATLLMGFQMVIDYEGNTAELTKEQADLAFQALDADGGGEIDSSEFISELKKQKTLMAQAKKQQQKQKTLASPAESSTYDEPEDAALEKRRERAFTIVGPLTREKAVSVTNESPTPKAHLTATLPTANVRPGDRKKKLTRPDPLSTKTIRHKWEVGVISPLLS